MNALVNNIRRLPLFNRKFDRLVVSLIVVHVLALALLGVGCAALERTRNPETNTVSPSKVEEGIGTALVMTNALPPSPYTDAVKFGLALIGSLAAGYGLKHVRDLPPPRPPANPPG